MTIYTGCDITKTPCIICKDNCFTNTEIRHEGISIHIPICATCMAKTVIGTDFKQKAEKLTEDFIALINDSQYI